jgi:hypothetical protein
LQGFLAGVADKAEALREFSVFWTDEETGLQLGLRGKKRLTDPSSLAYIPFTFTGSGCCPRDKQPAMGFSP